MSAVIATEQLAVAPPPDRHRRPWLTLLVVGLVLAPVAATVISVIGRHWHATGDQALEVLRTHDVGTGHTPVLGAWSRWGWAHPGPALFWALAPSYRLFGDTGVLVGMGILNGAAIAGVVLVAHRRGGTELAALAGLTMALLVRALGVDLLIDPWNPWAAFLPFVLFLVLTWSVLCRDWPMLPVAVLVGSYVVQAHAGYLPFVAVLGVLVVGYGLAAALRHRSAPGNHDVRARRWLGVTGVVAIVLWLPPLLQQMFGDHGNLSALVSYIRHPREAVAGWEPAFGSLGAELRPAGPWVTGNDDGGIGFTATSAVWPAVAMLSAMAGAAAVAWRRGQRDSARLPLLAMLTAGLAVLAASKLTGGFFVYATRWWWAVAAVATLGVVWALVKAFDSPALRRLVNGVALAAIVVAGAMTATGLPATFPQTHGSEVIAALANSTAGAMDQQSRYLVRGIDGTQLHLVSKGMFLELEGRGFHVYVEPGDGVDLQFGSPRVATADQVDAVVSIVDVSELAGPPDPRSRLIARFDPLTTAERSRTRELDAAIRAQVGDRIRGRIWVDNSVFRLNAVMAGASPEAVQQLGDLQLRGDGYAVYLSPSR